MIGQAAEEIAMRRDEALEYARWWCDAWNRRDIEAVLAHFEDDVTFTSPTALATVGIASVAGKEALRSYWQAALRALESLRFSLERILWDGVSRELVIIYSREANGKKTRVAECLEFSDSGRVMRGEVFHGVVP